jgi:hypothetical protein
MCLKPPPGDWDNFLNHEFRKTPMRRLPLKALFAVLTLNKTEKKRLDWDRVILIFSTAVTVGLIALYAYGKATSRW